MTGRDQIQTSPLYAPVETTATAPSIPGMRILQTRLVDIARWTRGLVIPISTNRNETQSDRWVYKNRPNCAEIDVTIKWEQTMKPSDSTRLLVSNMDITPGERVLDMGTGSGILIVAAHKLGAGFVTGTDIHREFLPEILDNLCANGIPRAAHKDIDIRFGDLFEPVEGVTFDHLIINPPSIPSPPGNHFDAAYDSGPYGRAIIDRFLRNAYTSLSKGGRITMVHGSLANLPKSIDMLREEGFIDIEISTPEEFQFKDFYPVEYLESLKAQGMAEFRKAVDHKDGTVRYYERRCVLTAVWPGDKK